MNDRTGTPAKEGNSTADRALSILEMFSHERRILTAKDVADGLGVARSTAYRYLQTLVSAGYLEEASDAGFALGTKIVELARVAQGRNDLSDLAVSEMRRISDTYGQTVLLTKLVGDAILCTEQEEPASQFVRLSYRRGKQMAVNAGASALVCIAWLDEPALRGLLERRPLEQISPGTIAEREPLLTRLAKIREDGYVVTRGEVDPEGMGIAVPIFDSSGRNVLAGLSVVALQSRIARDEVRPIVDDLLTASASITAGLRSYRD